MAKNKKTLSIILVFAVFALSFFSLERNRANAFSSFAPITTGVASGLLFESDDIKIEKQSLNISINDDATATINSSYVLKNNSSDKVNTRAAFLNPAKFNQDSDIFISDNYGLTYNQQFFDYPYSMYNSPIDMYNIFPRYNSINTPTKPLGEGNDFWEYRISSQGNRVEARFVPSSHYFVSACDEYIDNGYSVYLANNDYYIDWDIVVVSQQDISFITSDYVEKTPIPDIYTYLYDEAVQNTYSEEQLRFTEQQFAIYLNNLETSALLLPLCYFYEIDTYTEIVSFNLDFEPNQILTLDTSHTFDLGIGSGVNSVELLYLFTFYQNYSESFEIDIYLYLGEIYSEITYMNIPLHSDYDGMFSLNSSIAEANWDNMMVLGVSDGVFFTQSTIWILTLIGLIISLTIILPIAIFVIIILAIVSVANRNRTKNKTGYNNNNYNYGNSNYNLDYNNSFSSNSNNGYNNNYRQ